METIRKIKNITLKHLYINDCKQIGIQFYPDKIVQTTLKSIPNIKWSDTYGMAYLKNNKDNLNLIFNSFKGIAWVNCCYFFPNSKIKNNAQPFSIKQYREKKTNKTKVPEGYLQKLAKIRIKTVR